jgi:V/A-type H+-transporting ATPase subunit K
MQILITLLTLSTITLILAGLYFGLYPERLDSRLQRRFKGGIALNLALFVGGIGALLLTSMGEVMAAAEAAQQSREISTGLGLALIGIGLPTGLATIGAGIAVSSVGAASLAVIVEKPEIFGRTLIYLGLAEGIAIYGLVVTILLLGKI